MMLTTRELRNLPNRLTKSSSVSKVKNRKYLYEILPDGSWQGKRCFIIGGGSSLKNFDFSVLQNELTIGINRSALEKIETTIMLAADVQLFHWITKGRLGLEIKDKFYRFRGFKVWVCSADYEYSDGIYVLNSLGNGAFTNSMKLGLGIAGSGYAAINLAVCLGANPIYLLGFDGKGNNGRQTWWHAGYPTIQGSEVYNKFNYEISRVAPELKRKGIQVINLNPESALKCFEFGKFEDLKKEKPMSSGIQSKEITDEEVFYEGALGFGDNFYQRSIIRYLAEKHQTIYLGTTCPELYWDISNIRFVHPGLTRLRTQNKHIAKLPKDFFVDKPPGVRRLSWRYRPIIPRHPEISQCEFLRHSANMTVADFDFSFPIKPEWIEAAQLVMAGLDLRGKKFCLIRPPTVRKEWFNRSRNPKIEYMQTLINRYKDDYFFISVADLKDGEEWLDGTLTGIDLEFNHGEIPLTTIFGLIKISDMVITTPSWGMLAGISERVKCFSIFGGCAKPEIVTDPIMGLENFGYVAPQPFCNCIAGGHDCNKDIPESRLIEAFEELKNRPITKPKEEKVIRWESLSRKTTELPLPPDPEKHKIGKDVFFQGCYGFGDNLWQRPVIRWLVEQYDTIYLKTPIPEFYWDLPHVRFIYPNDIDAGTGHRTPSKHLRKLPAGTFLEKPAGIKEMRWHYKFQHIEDRCYLEDENGTQHEVPKMENEPSIYENIRRIAGIPKEEYFYDLPVKNEWLDAAKDVIDHLDLKGKKLCIIHPPTVRKEWEFPSRNPKIEYFQFLVDKYKDIYFFLSIADIDGDQEWLDGELIGIDAKFHGGELPITTLLGLFKLADITITPPTGIAHMSMAVNGKTFIIFGGHAGPEYILDPALTSGNHEYVAPAPFCNCWKNNHNCNKEIPKELILAKFETLRNKPRGLKRITIGLPPGIGDVLWPCYILESFKERHGIDHLTVRFYDPWGYTSLFLKNLPFIDDAQGSPKEEAKLPFSYFLTGGHGKPLYKNKAGLDYMIEFGSQLELCVPLEKIMPDYKVNWNMKIRGLDQSDEYVANIRDVAGGRLNIFYTSSKGGNEAWARNAWTVNDWMELATLFYQENKCKIILVGMNYDKSYTDGLKALDKHGIIIDMVGRADILQTLATIKGADLFVGFSSGLCMMACHFKVPCVTFWPIRGISQNGVYESGFMYSWLPPWSRNSDTYLGVPYGAPESTPQGIFKRLRKFL